jgi:hypothetical protein
LLEHYRLALAERDKLLKKKSAEKGERK